MTYSRMVFNDYVKQVNHQVEQDRFIALYRNKLCFLGHQISAKGIEPHPTKLDVIRRWPRPANTKDLRAFLGLCSYYSDFIPNLQDRARVLNQLTGKSKFMSSFDREAAFNVILQFPT